VRAVSASGVRRRGGACRMPRREAKRTGRGNGGSRQRTQTGAGHRGPRVGVTTWALMATIAVSSSARIQGPRWVAGKVVDLVCGGQALRLSHRRRRQVGGSGGSVENFAPVRFRVHFLPDQAARRHRAVNQCGLQEAGGSDLALLSVAVPGSAKRRCTAGEADPRARRSLRKSPASPCFT
jgi:hypothetical protein